MTDECDDTVSFCYVSYVVVAFGRRMRCTAYANDARTKGD